MTATDDKKIQNSNLPELGYKNEAFEADGGVDLVKTPPRPQDDPQPSEKIQLTIGEKWRILKNVAVLSIAFMVHFTAFQGTANLQSSINAADGLGTVSLSAIYAALVISSAFLPTYLIKKFTVKGTLCICMMGYIPYIAAQFYPRFYTLVPAGAILGIGAAPMWAAKATYLTQVGSVYAKITDQPVDAIIVRFFGFFFTAWQTAELWGNLISSLVLSSGAHGKGSAHGLTNLTHHKSLDVCGANFCVVSNHGNENLERPPDQEICDITLIYLGCIVCAIFLVACLLDPLHRYGEKVKKASAPGGGMKELCTATILQLKKPNQCLLIMLTLWIGMEQAFVGADFTQAYVSCALGIHQIGYVMICFGVVNAICSIMFGTVMKFTGRIPIVVGGKVIHLALIFVLLHWRPNPDNPIVFYCISGLWGVGDAVWQTQVNGLYGTLFRRNKEAAFSNYRLWESVGFVIAYAYSTKLCARMKLYVMLFVLISGFLGYVVVEFRHSRKARRLKAIAEKEVAPPEVPEEDDEKDDTDENIRQ